MAYSKLFLTTQDHAIGFQSMNQAIDNNAALKDLYEAKHSLGVGGNSPYGFPLRSVGRHDDIVIARSVSRYGVDTSLAVPALTVLQPGSMPSFAQRMGTGQWRIFVSTPQLFGAVALMESSASIDRKASVYPAYDPATGPQVIVTTRSAWAEADLPFSLIIWAQAA